MKKQEKLKRKKKKRRRKEDGKKQETYAVEVDGDGSVRFDRCCFATQRHNLAEDADGLVGESLKIRRVNTRRSFRGGHVFFDSVLENRTRWKSGKGREARCGRGGVEAGVPEGSEALFSRRGTYRKCTTLS